MPSPACSTTSLKLTNRFFPSTLTLLPFSPACNEMALLKRASSSTLPSRAGTVACITILGTGCETVVRTATPDTDIITGTWSKGRVGTLHALRGGPTPHKVIVFGTKAVAEQKGGEDYAPLLREVVKFFQTGVAPVTPEETIELFAFMEAADESKRQGGAPVKIKDVLKKNGG